MCTGWPNVCRRLTITPVLALKKMMSLQSPLLWEDFPHHFWNLAAEIRSYKATKVLVSSMTDVGDESTVDVSIIIKMLDGVEVRDMLRPVKLFHTYTGKTIYF